MHDPLQLLHLHNVEDSSMTWDYTCPQTESDIQVCTPVAGSKMGLLSGAQLVVNIFNITYLLGYWHLLSIQWSIGMASQCFPNSFLFARGQCIPSLGTMYVYIGCMSIRSLQINWTHDTDIRHCKMWEFHNRLCDWYYEMLRPYSLLHV